MLTFPSFTIKVFVKRLGKPPEYGTYAMDTFKRSNTISSMGFTLNDFSKQEEN
jgi:hypothetical protein